VLFWCCLVGRFLFWGFCCDMKIDLHMHSTASDGSCRLRSWLIGLLRRD